MSVIEDLYNGKYRGKGYPDDKDFELIALKLELENEIEDLKSQITDGQKKKMDLISTKFNEISELEKLMMFKNGIKIVTALYSEK